MDVRSVYGEGRGERDRRLQCEENGSELANLL